MDDKTVDSEFEKIALNEQILVIDRELGRATVPVGTHDKDSKFPFAKFLNPVSGPLPDIDMDLEDPWRNFTTGRTDI